MLLVLCNIAKDKIAGTKEDFFIIIFYNHLTFSLASHSDANAVAV